MDLAPFHTAHLSLSDMVMLYTALYLFCSVLIYPLTSAMPSADGSPLSRNQAKKLRLTRPSCRFRSFPTSASVRVVRFIPFFQSIFVDFDSGSPGNNIKGVKTKSQDYACCICQCQLMKNDKRGYRHKKSCFQSSSTSQYTKSISEIIKCSKVK